MKTQAAVFDGVGQPLRVQEIDVADPRGGEVLVKLAASGVCHSDFHVVKGEWDHDVPVVLGHEGAGVVEEVGPGVTTVQPGDHVVLSWVPYCGTCKYCLERKPALCPQLTETSYDGVMLDGTTRFSREGHPVLSYSAMGSFAEYVVVPETGAVAVRKDAPLEIISLVGCAVATGVGAVINTARVQPGDSVLVIGCGGVGLSAVMGANLISAGKIIAADVNDGALERARALGATHVINTRNQDLATVVAEIVGEDGLDWAFEAIGLKQTIEAMYDIIRPGGTAVVVGQAPEGVRISIDPLVMSDREKSLIGSSYGSCHPAIDFPRLVDLYMEGKLNLDALIARTAPLTEVNEAFDAMGRGEDGRTVLVFGAKEIR